MAKRKSRTPDFVFCGGAILRPLWLLDGINGTSLDELARNESYRPAINLTMGVQVVFVPGFIESEHLAGHLKDAADTILMSEYLEKTSGLLMVNLHREGLALITTTPFTCRTHRSHSPKIEAPALSCEVWARNLTAQERSRYEILLIAAKGDKRWLSESWSRGGEASNTKAPSKATRSTSPSRDP